MKLTEEELKDLYRERIAAPAPQRVDCLTDDLLLRAAAKELTRDERRRVIDHLRECSDCAQEYRAAHETRRWAEQVVTSLDQTSEVDVNKITKPSPPLAELWARVMSTPVWRTGVFATVVLMAVGVSLIAWRAMYPTASVPVERGGSGLTIKVDPPDRAQVNEAPQQLSWTEVKEAQSYQVAIYDLELAPVWESGPVKGTAVRIPDSIRATLPRGRPIFWRVIVNSGIERRQSELFQFVVSASPK